MEFSIRTSLALLLVLVLVGIALGSTISVDSDGVPFLAEVVGETEPMNSDTDNDGLHDGIEINGNTDPLESDTDGDNLSDYLELRILETLATERDTDNDGLNDGVEYNKYDSNPTVPDTDADGLEDGEEINIYGTDPSSSDTDKDGLNDSKEVLNLSTDPVSEDSDSDGIADGQEVNKFGTDPKNADTDDDKINDSEEINIYGTDPSSSDTDNDELTDYEEINNYNSSPVIKDTDEDGLSDGNEILNNTDPNKKDTDSDGLNDHNEITNETDPNNPDTDSDGLRDGIELKNYGSDPNSAYTVENGLNDSQHLVYGLSPTEDPSLKDLKHNLTGVSIGEFVFESSFGIDSDEDGFSDSFEQNMQGFSKDVKDIAVEIAWTQGNDPSVSSLLNIREAYRGSPVDNGDGINIHFYLVGEVDAPRTIDGRALYDYYNRRYKGVTGSHYALFTDTVVSDGEEVGGFSLYEVPAIAVSSQDEDQANGGVLMHEMGHSLGLIKSDYVGIDSNKKSIEQYPSIMNYESISSCSVDISKCYRYSSGVGYDDWRYIEQNIESGSVTPTGVYYIQ